MTEKPKDNNYDFLKQQLLPELVDRKIVSAKVKYDYDAYQKYLSYRMQGFKVSLCVLWTADDFGISEYSVYKIKRFMEK